MRRLLGWLLVACLAPLALAGTIIVRRASGGSPPVSFDLIDEETFNQTAAYDETGWTEYTSGSGAFVDDDETVTCPADTGFDGECLQTGTTTNSRKYIAYNTLVGSPISGNVYCRVYFNITDVTGWDTTETFMFAALTHANETPDVSGTPLRMQLTNTTGTLAIRGNCAGGTFGTTTITAGTTYLLEMYANQGTNTCDFKLDGTAKGPYALASILNDITYANFGSGSAVAHQVDIVYDNVACDSGGWIGGL